MLRSKFLATLFLALLLFFPFLVLAADLIVEGNVGIGTASPVAKLEVVGTVKGVVPMWTVKVCSANNYTSPSQFNSPIATFNLPSFGSAFVHYDNGDRWGYNNSVLFTMTVNSKGNQTKTLKLFSVDNWVYIYLRGTLIYSYIGAATFDDAPASVTFNLVDGVNLIEIVFADQGGAWHLSLLGNLIDNSNVYFVSP